MMIDHAEDVAPRETARLQAENEALTFECALLRREVDRLSTINRTLEGRLALTTGERDRLKTYLNAIESSRPWRLIQKLRGMLGRRW